jgi:hypothetical protein
LTPNKKYAILEEKGGIQVVNGDEVPTYIYVVSNDLGKKVQIPSIYFVPEQKGLIGMNGMESYSSPKLSHMGDGGMEMPVLRR